MIGPTLSPRPDRNELVGFALGLGLTLGCVAGGILALLGATEWLISAVALCVLVWAVPFAHRPLARWCYGRWNRIARLYGRAASELTKAVMYFAVILPARSDGSKLRLDGPWQPASNWNPRTSKESSEDRLHGRLSDPYASGGWIRGYLRWSREEGYRWSAALLPYLLLLRLLETDDVGDATPSHDIYTLY